MDRPNFAIENEGRVAQILTKQQLADRWHFSIDTIERIMRGRLIRYFRIGRRVLFRLRDVEEFESARLTRAKAF